MTILQNLLQHAQNIPDHIAVRVFGSGLQSYHTLSLAPTGKITIKFYPALTAKGENYADRLNSLLHQYADHLTLDWKQNFVQFDYYALANFAKQPCIVTKKEDS